MIADHTVNDMVMRNHSESFRPALTAFSGRLTNDEMLAALAKLRARVSEWKGRMDDRTVEEELEVIDKCLKGMQSKG